MYKRDLDTLLASKKMPNFLLLRSSDEFQNELYAKEILNFYQADMVEQIYYDEYDFSRAKLFFEPSLFGNSNLLHIKTNRYIPTKEVKQLISMCKKDSANFFLYEILETPETKVSNDFIKAFGTNFVRFFKPTTPNEALNLLNKKCTMLKIYANSTALLEIYKIHNENLNLAASELEKFANLGYEVTLENVKVLVSGLSEVSFEDIFNKILNLDDFRDDFFIYTQSGSYSESDFINYIYGSFFRLFKIHSFIKINGRIDFLKLLGYTPPPQVQTLLQKQALKFSTKRFKEIFLHLNSLEFDIKTKNQIDKTHFLLAGLLELQRVIAKTK
ncbi:DNA polymerase III subunit delta [Campylobacter geochelonis]|uniref:DNA polymerase III subunit delta n=1 Tax=Campylobacter geochelonis TaxID=1780362 RepID=UPI00077088C1|nr:DNA polymerase III subunit delta [Campylobacter geochelonis]CZE47637.1 DNA polymerase III subunit delta [Campylobacter geochelonis]CZE50168.1 DNA polymerase III subunit delta [Campylobacter geochelonis]